MLFNRQGVLCQVAEASVCRAEFTNKMYQIYTVPSGEPRKRKTVISPYFHSASSDTQLGHGGLENRSLSAFK